MWDNVVPQIKSIDIIFPDDQVPQQEGDSGVDCRGRECGVSRRSSSPKRRRPLGNTYLWRPTILITPGHNHRDFETTLAATINAVETELSATETTLFATSPQY